MPIASYRAYVCGYPIPIVIGAIARPEFCRAVPQQVELRVESTALAYPSCLDVGGGCTTGTFVRHFSEFQS